MTETLKVFNVGEDKCECEHDFVCDDKLKSFFTVPPKYIRERICKKCGRYEYVQENEMSVSDNEEFKRVKKEFGLE